MTNQSQRDKLKRHFAGRVTTQARIVLEAWQRLNQYNWHHLQWFQEFQSGVEKLGRYASRFDMTEHLSVAQGIHNTLKSVKLRNDVVCNKDVTALEKHIVKLASITQRKSDNDSGSSSSVRTYIRSPIYIAIQDDDLANRIEQQMMFFGFRGQRFFSESTLEAATQRNKPETMIIDVNFGGVEHAGLTMIKRIQANHETPIPILYVCPNSGNIESRLLAARSGGEEFFAGQFDISKLIEKVETFTRVASHEPYRVMVVDDSKAQSAFIESVLTKSGIIAKSITDPMQLLVALNDFKPELIIMDMYMPGCTGTELAKVIRQQDQFVGVPIIYLSAEDDINKQLHAMSLGGDDFLVKPINPRHLVATIHNRGRRARSLHAMLIRDSLTGLFNHTHTLNLLRQEIERAEVNTTPLSFAMMDIDFFKKINDQYGHPVGDRVIKSIALFLKQRLRKADSIGRYGGEEFAVILPQTNETDARDIMNDIRERFSELIHPTETESFHATFSCGVASYHSGDTHKELAQRADIALYEAKNSGRNCVKIFRKT